MSLLPSYVFIKDTLNACVDHSDENFINISRHELVVIDVSEPCFWVVILSMILPRPTSFSIFSSLKYLKLSPSVNHFQY